MFEFTLLRNRTLLACLTKLLRLCTISAVSLSWLVIKWPRYMSKWMDIFNWTQNDLLQTYDSVSSPNSPRFELSLIISSLISPLFVVLSVTCVHPLLGLLLHVFLSFNRLLRFHCCRQVVPYNLARREVGITNLTIRYYNFYCPW